MTSTACLYRAHFREKKQWPEASGRARAPATCGELMQGSLDGQDFLINCPIAYYADIRVQLTGDGLVRVVTPGTFTKVKLAVERTLALHGAGSSGALIDVVVSIPAGKGLASSTAEMTAAMVATSWALGRGGHWLDCYTETLLSLDHSTDSVYQAGVVWSRHLTGEIVKTFRSLPPLAFVLVDTGGVVETASFDRQHARKVSARHARRLRAARAMMSRGFTSGDPCLIARAATESALINEEVLAKEGLAILLEGSRAYGGLGVNCAHTGTVLGVMFNPRISDGAALERRVANLMGAERVLGTFPLASGGTIVGSE